MASSSNLVWPLMRTYTLDRGEFGTVNRANVLGLRDAPEILLDDNSRVAYFGPHVKQTIVDAVRAVDLDGHPHSLPIDVKYVGYTYLSQYGYTAEQQEALLLLWRSLPQATKDQYATDWDAIDKNDANAVVAFVTDLVTFLQSMVPA